MPFLVSYVILLLLLELVLGFLELSSHLLVPLFDTVEYTGIFIVLVLPNLFLSLFNLLLLELNLLFKFSLHFPLKLIRLKRVLKSLECLEFSYLVT